MCVALSALVAPTISCISYVIQRVCTVWVLRVCLRLQVYVRM